MKSEQQCRGMQIYNANRPTKPPKYFYLYTSNHYGVLYTHTRQIQTQEFKQKKKKKKKVQQGCQTTLCLSRTGIPEQCASSAHAIDVQGHAKGEKSEQKLHNKKIFIFMLNMLFKLCVHEECFGLHPVFVKSFCLSHLVKLECNQYFTVTQLN